MRNLQTITVEVIDRVGLITLNRPKVLNALSARVAVEVVEVLKELEENADVGAIVITGSSRAFAAGADISEMAEKTFVDMYGDDMFSIWDEARTIKKPIVAAVSGFALGGGCELALLCDFAVAAEDAKFGLPEIKLGIIPGIGGTQRLTRAVGKALAMDMILTGRTIGAREAMQAGLISRIVPPSDVITGAIEAARIIASYNGPAVALAKESVNSAFETTLSQGLRHERRLFQATFATEGQKEGMRAFLEKRSPQFTQR